MDSDIFSLDGNVAVLACIQLVVGLHGVSAVRRSCLLLDQIGESLRRILRVIVTGGIEHLEIMRGRTLLETDLHREVECRDIGSGKRGRNQPVVLAGVRGDSDTEGILPFHFKSGIGMKHIEL